MQTSVKMVSEASYQIQVTSTSVLNGNDVCWSAVVVVFENMTSCVTLKPMKLHLFFEPNYRGGPDPRHQFGDSFPKDPKGVITST